MRVMKRVHPPSRSKESQFEEVQEIFRKLGKKARDTVVIVEGKKDRSSLRKLGVEGKIICMKHSRRILVDFLDQLQCREVVLFVDFDEYGSSLTRTITQYLEAKRVKVNTVFWKRMKGLVGRYVKDVEGLPSYLEKLKKSPHS
jgi:5S rRNA maturation endonuclease (ribonuclease M5)